MEKINVKELNDNVFETIGKEWMLVCAGNKDKFNMMTASWGCLGWLWNKPVAVVFIRPERFTHGIIEENEFMTLSFLGHSEEARKIYNFCGSKSGRDFDKAKETGLTPVETDNGSIAFEQSRLTLECRKLYKDNMTAEKFLDKDLLQWYGAKGGFHDVYVVEITNAYNKVIFKYGSRTDSNSWTPENQAQGAGALRGNDVQRRLYTDGLRGRHPRNHLLQVAGWGRSIMLKVHHEEKAVVGTYSYDIAKSKVEKAMEKARTQKFPLKLTYMPE